MMPGRYHTLATSSSPFARSIRWMYRAGQNFSLPVPLVLVWPAVQLFLIARAGWHFFLRVFLCEPFFKAHCREYGQAVHTGVYLHWIQGQGDIIVGDHVKLDGKSSISFAARFVDRPTLTLGSHTGLGHGCSLVVGKAITIGNHCRIAGGVAFRDSSGHASEPEARKAGLPPDGDDVRPITINDNVWIGTRAFIGPGVTVGEGSIVAAHAVVFSDVAPYTIVAGNPARKIGTLRNPTAVTADRTNSTAEPALV
jgi:acetyltransferase-like isoleucine patch superfamily enzyme